MELLRANDVVPLLADWTDHSPEIKQTLNELGYNSIPLLAIWPAQPPGAEPIVLPDVITQSQLLGTLEKAGPSIKP